MFLFSEKKPRLPHMVVVKGLGSNRLLVKNTKMNVRFLVCYLCVWCDTGVAFCIPCRWAIAYSGHFGLLLHNVGTGQSIASKDCHFRGPVGRTLALERGLW